MHAYAGNLLAVAANISFINYVARCQELGISSFAKTIEKALDRVTEAVGLYLSEIEEAGERDRVFAESGIKKAGMTIEEFKSYLK